MELFSQNPKEFKEDLFSIVCSTQTFVKFSEEKSLKRVPYFSPIMKALCANSFDWISNLFVSISEPFLNIVILATPRSVDLTSERHLWPLEDPGHTATIITGNILSVENWVFWKSLGDKSSEQDCGYQQCHRTPDIWEGKTYQTKHLNDTGTKEPKSIYRIFAKYFLWLFWHDLLRKECICHLRLNWTFSRLE